MSACILGDVTLFIGRSIVALYRAADAIVGVLQLSLIGKKTSYPPDAGLNLLLSALGGSSKRWLKKYFSTVVCIELADDPAHPQFVRLRCYQGQRRLLN